MNSKVNRTIPTVFLGGPIQYASPGNDRFDVSLRHAIESFVSILLSEGYKVFSAHFEEGFGEIDYTNQYKFVAQRDFDWMKQCDIYVALLPNDGAGRPYRSDGTCIELGWASALNKPVVTILEDEVKHSHLIRGLSSITRYKILDFELLNSNPLAVISSIKAMV